MTLASLVIERRQALAAARQDADAAHAQRQADERAWQSGKFADFCAGLPLQDLLDDFHFYICDGNRQLLAHCPLDMAAAGTVTLDDMTFEVAVTVDAFGNVQATCTEAAGTAVSTRHIGLLKIGADADGVRQTLVVLVDETAAEAQPKIARQRAALALGERVVELAATYLEQHTLWERLHYDHALFETQRLWRPFRAWLVRYVPVGGRANGSEDDDLVCELWSLTRPETLASSPASLIKVERISGHTQEHVIGALLDAAPVQDVGDGMPSVKGTCLFYRSYASGPYWINVPPAETRAPDVLDIPDMSDFMTWLRETHGIEPGGWLDAGDVMQRGIEAINLNAIQTYKRPAQDTAELPF